MQIQKRERPKIGLALSGGTLKAAAHIGVIEQLAKMNIVPDVVAGTSAGSFIATLYAHGYTPTMMKQLSRHFSILRLVDYGFPLLSSALNVVRYRLGMTIKHKTVKSAQGLLAGHKLERYVRSSLGKTTPKIPYYVIATDLKTGSPIVFSNDTLSLQSGHALPFTNPAKAVTASCALPGIFSPVEMDDYLLVDGAFRDYVPVKVLQEAGCDKIIAINLYQLEDNWYPLTIAHVLVRSFEILLMESIDTDLASLNNVVIIEPDTKNMSWFSVKELPHCIEYGRRAVEEKAEEILNMLTKA